MADKPPVKCAKWTIRLMIDIRLFAETNVTCNSKEWTIGSVEWWSWFSFTLKILRPKEKTCMRHATEIKSTDGWQATRKMCKVNHQTHDRHQTTFRDKFHLQFLRVDHRFSWELVMIQFYIGNNLPKRKYLHASLRYEKLLQQTSYMSHC